MTELGELINYAAELTAERKNQCPFCGKQPHGFGADEKKKASDTVKSIPKNLGYTDALAGGTGAAPYRYTTAAHHLICAIQCYAKIKALVRMGNLVGYDINSKPNGIPLPTVRNPYYGKNFGELSDVKDGNLSKQDRIAFAVMDRTNAQWHVGHHSFEITIVEYDESEGGEDSEYEHTTSYDCEVIEMLLDITILFMTSKLCDDDPGNADDFKETMNDISTEIATHLKKFATRSPYDSKPFFVSDRAFEYAKAVQDNIWKRGIS
jgi:A nuclease family of the HNH/ENDO VII superfamily with conserved AHH